MAYVIDTKRNLDLDGARAAARETYVTAHPVSRAHFEAAKAVMPGGNTRTVLHYAPFPFTVVKADGARIFDADGHDYADFLGEYTAGLYGHNHPLIEAALAQALKGGLTLGGPNEVEAKLARVMCERFEALDRVRFCNSGTEANVFAVGAARAFTGRSDILVVDGAYHGGVLTFRGESPPLNVPYPTHRIVYNDAQAAVDRIRALGGELAAVLVEPMIGAGGCIPADGAFLRALREASRDTGALLIFDEVMTSRQTAGGLQGYHHVTPDLATFGKYLGGGLTFGAFGGRADIMDRFDPGRPDAWAHAGTFNNNILTMTAGYVGLSEIYTPQAADAFFDRGNAFRESLAAAVAAIDIPVRITGLGSMMAFHFAHQAPTAPGGTRNVPPGLYELIHLDMIERGQFHARRGMINLALPTTDAALDAFRTAFTDTLEVRAPIIREVVG